MAQSTMPRGREAWIRLTQGLWILPISLVVLAGVSKLVDPESFARSLATWTLVPSELREPAAIAVPVFELGVGLAALVGLWRWRAILFVSLFLVFVTTIFVFEWVVASPPDCGCLGVIAAWNDAHSDPVWVVGRNSVLLLLLGLSGYAHRRRRRGEQRPVFDGDSLARTGFSLVEMLVVLAVMAILVTLALPALRRSILEARESASLSNLRMHAANISMYAADHRGTLPWFTDVATWNLTLAYGGRDYGYPHFFQTSLWPVGMVSYYGGVWPHESLCYPGIRDDNSYYLSSSTLAAPEFWDPVRRVGPEQWKPQHLHDATFASQKALLVSGPLRAVPWWYTHPKSVSYGLFDGSAGRFGAARLVEPLLTGDGVWYGAYMPRGVYGMHTIRGLHGRDIR